MNDDVLDLRDKPVRTLGELAAWCADLKFPTVIVSEAQRRTMGILDVRVVDVVGECAVAPRELLLLAALEVKP